MSQNEVPQAETYIRRALIVDPDYHDAHYNFAQVLTGKGQCEEAIKHYQTCLNARAGLVLNVYNNLGLLLQEKGDMEGAIRNFELAVKYDPSNPTRRITLAKCLEKTNPERAAKLRQEASHLQRDASAGSRGDLLYAEVYCETGQLLERIGRNADAIRQYRKALEHNPGHETSRNRLKVLEKPTQERPSDQ